MIYAYEKHYGQEVDPDRSASAILVLVGYYERGRMFVMRYSANFALVYAAYGCARSSFAVSARSLIDLIMIAGISCV